MIPRWGKVYYDISEYGLAYFCFSIIFHMIYDETLTYWVHRWMHTFPRLYELLHRVHHKSYDVTPFSGFAFHPFDAFA
jgi:lathosterol oxidase